MKTTHRLLLILLISLLLSACGGGSGGSVAVGGGGSAAVGGGTGRIQQKVTLSWTAPVTRTDGSSIAPAELDGYRIYYGNSPSNLSMQLDINDATQTSASIDLPPGSYDIAVTVYDVNGLESSFSNVVHKDVI